MKIQNLYLVKVFTKSKVLFSFIFLFIVFQSYFYYIKSSTFPWFYWSLYAYTENLPDTMIQREVFINGDRLDVTTIPIWQESIIMHTFSMYNWQHQNGFNDPQNELVKKRTRFFPKKVYSYAAYKINNQKEEAVTYPNWLIQYLSKITGKRIEIIEYKEVRYKYNVSENKFIALDNWVLQRFEY